MDNKIYKPKNCSLCPAVRVEKVTIVCGCKKDLKADKNNLIERLAMWRNCPLAWEENKEETKEKSL